MAIVEGVNVPAVRAAGPPMQYLSVSTSPEMFGAGVGRALQGLGGSISDAAAVMAANNEKLASEAADVASTQAFVDASIAAGEAEAEYSQLQGMDAVNEYETYTNRLREIRQAALDSLTDDEARSAFDKKFAPTMLSNFNQGATYAAGQKRNALIGSAEAQLELVMNDSRTKFADDTLFATNLDRIDATVEQLAAVQGWDPVATVAKQQEQRSLAWEYRITSMSLNDPVGASTLFNKVRDNLGSESRLRIEKDLQTTLYQRGGEMFVSDVMLGANRDVRPSLQQGVIAAGLPENVSINIADRTSVKGMQPRAWQILNGAAAAAAELGIRLEVTAGVGGGHVSHGRGTEWDLKGYQANGKLWTPEQRAAVARGGAASGADRFGLYSFGAGYVGNGSLHIGFSGEGRPPAVWGYGGRTRGEESRYFQNPYERQFLVDFNRGNLATGGPVRGATGGDFRSRILAAEGGGSGVVSPAGAMGLMQVMPATGAQVAAQLGIPFDAWRLKHDNDYNLLIGTTYLNQLLEKYDGDEVLAAAAYNGGPGSVDSWLKTIGDPRTGSISYAEWVASIPFDETRKYVGKVMNGTVPANRAPVTSATNQASFAETMADAQAWAEMVRPGDPVFAMQIVSAAETQYNRMVKADTEAQAENYDWLLGAAIEKGEDGERPTSIEQILGTAEAKERWEALSPTSQLAIENQLKSNLREQTGAGPTVESFREYERILGLSQAADLSAFKSEDIAGNALLTAAMKEELIKLRAKPPEEIKAAKPVSFDHAMTIARPSLAVLGWAPNAKKDENKQLYNQFVGSLITNLQLAFNAKGSALTDVEIHDLIQRMLIETQPAQDFWIEKDKPAVYGFQEPTFAGTLTQTFGAQVTVPTGPSIPDEARKFIVDNYVSKHGTVPNEAIIQQYYKALTAPKVPQ